MRRKPLWAGWLALVGLCAAPVALSADRALLIGIERYLDAQIPPLQGMANDVRDMRQLALDTLGYRPEQIKTLVDGEATRAGILDALDQWLIKGSQPGDRILFYYSGHGYQMPDTDGDEQDGLDETLVSADTTLDQQGQFRNMISDDELQARFERLADRQVTIVVDSCHSGTITRSLADPADREGRKTLPPRATRGLGDFSKTLAAHRVEESLLKGQKNRVVWSAVTAAQVALVDQEATPPGSVFTRRFLAGLRDRQADQNGNGVVSYTELLDYLQKESTAYCQRRPPQACGWGLTPTLEIDPVYYGQPVFAFESTPIPVPDLAAELLSHDNSLQAQLEILPGRQFRLGDTMKIRVTSPRDGYLVVLDRNAKGQITQIFPNKYSDKAGKRNRIYANRPITIPDAFYGFQFSASEPTGPGQLIAIISEDPVPLDDVLSQHKDLRVVARPAAYLTTLAERLRQPWTGDPFNRQVSWSQITVDYEIAR